MQTYIYVITKANHPPPTVRPTPSATSEPDSIRLTSFNPLLLSAKISQQLTPNHAIAP
ncbi:hypothetical protein ACSS6W_008565 [Trichoderma asperelloides]